MFSQIEGSNFELQGADQKTLSMEYLFGNHLNESIKVPNICKDFTFLVRHHIYQ